MITRGHTFPLPPVSHLSAFSVSGPHFLSGEPVPSCTDLVAVFVGIRLAGLTPQFPGHKGPS